MSRPRGSERWGCCRGCRRRDGGSPTASPRARLRHGDRSARWGHPEHRGPLHVPVSRARVPPVCTGHRPVRGRGATSATAGQAARQSPRLHPRIGGTGAVGSSPERRHRVAGDERGLGLGDWLAPAQNPEGLRRLGWLIGGDAIRPVVHVSRVRGTAWARRSRLHRSAIRVVGVGVIQRAGPETALCSRHWVCQGSARRSTGRWACLEPDARSTFRGSRPRVVSVLRSRSESLVQ